MAWAASAAGSSPRLRMATRGRRRCRAAIAAAPATRRRRSIPTSALRPQPISATRAAFQPLTDRKHEQLERLGLEFLGADGPGDGLAGRLAQTLEQRSRLLSLEYRQEQDVGFDRGCLGGHHADGLGRKRRRHPAIIW